MFNLTPWRKQTRKPRLFYSPFREMEDLANRMFSDFFSDTDFIKADVPALNMKREGENLVVEASLPGYDKKNITVELEDDLLTIRGEHKEEKETKESDYYHREFSFGSFSRSIRLPGKVKPEELKAKYTDGILKITIPSAEPEKKTKQITIE